MKGVRIEYGGVAVGAKEGFVPTTTDKESFVDLAELQRDIQTFPNYGNPCEVYSVLLDGNTEPFPEDTEDKNIGWWSEQLSGSDGMFDDPIVLTLNATNLYTSSGITFTFDTYNQIFANNIKIEWYRGDELLKEEGFLPDSAFFFCQERVDTYNKVVVTFYSINMPYNRLKLKAVDYGMLVTFYGDELKSVKLTQTIDELSSQISINTCDISLHSKRNINFPFQEQQPMEVYFNDVLRAKSFIKSSKRISSNEWTIKTEDYIGKLESVMFYGDIYTNKNAFDLFGEIFEKANTPCNISDVFQNVTVSGHIPFTNCREALMQVAFAVGAIVDTSDSAVVNIYKPNYVSSQTIPLSKIIQGQNFEETAKMTAVEITYHEYTTGSEDTMTIYEAEKNGTGEGIFVKFPEPIYELNIVSGNGEKIETGTNYAIINAYSDDFKIIGKKYKHTEIIKRQQNELVLETDSDNVITVTNATLVSRSNVDDVLARCFKYYNNNLSINMKIIERSTTMQDAPKYGSAKYGTFKYGGKSDKTKVGDTITCETEYMGEITGMIFKQTYSLAGGIIIKDTKVKKGGFYGA